MKTIITFFLVFFSAVVYSQNLVPNPGFEEYVSVPCSWLGTQTDLDAVQEDWYMLSGSPDVFTTLAPASCFASCNSNYYNAVGHQQPHSGDFMAGIITYGAGMGIDSQYREAYEIQLTSPLVVGQQYYAEMYVSLADSSAFASNNISLYFSVPHVPFDINNTGPLYFTPQVTETSIIADTAGWVKISGTFIADTPAQYLLIQNFTDDNLTEAYHTGVNGCMDAYYFIDDLLVKETCLSVSSNQTICQNESTQITASSPSFNGWALASDPSTIISTDPDFTVAPAVTTTYLALSDCDTFSVTVYVQTGPPGLVFGNDTTICEGTTLILQATDVNGSYVWQDGSTKPYYSVTTAGTYWLSETNECGTSYADIQVNVSPLPVFPFGNVLWLCEAGSILLYEMDATLLAYYLDTNGNYVGTDMITDPGFYLMRASNECGVSQRMVSVEVVSCPDGPAFQVPIEITMPNVVTPNGDQLNDLLVPLSINGIASMKTTVLNRWGEVIFETTDPAIKWNGEDYTEGVYYWKIEYTDFNSTSGNQHGFFHLLK